MKLSISGVELSWNNDDINQLATTLLSIKQSYENSLTSDLDEKTRKETQNTIKCIEWIVEEINSIDNNQLDPKILKKAIGNILENLDYNAILMTILIKYAEVLRSEE
jgi:hypothetical protein